MDNKLIQSQPQHQPQHQPQSQSQPQLSSRTTNRRAIIFSNSITSFNSSSFNSSSFNSSSFNSSSFNSSSFNSSSNSSAEKDQSILSNSILPSISSISSLPPTPTSSSKSSSNSINSILSSLSNSNHHHPQISSNPKPTSSPSTSQSSHHQIIFSNSKINLDTFNSNLHHQNQNQNQLPSSKINLNPLSFHQILFNLNKQPENLKLKFLSNSLNQNQLDSFHLTICSKFIKKSYSNTSPLIPFCNLLDSIHSSSITNSNHNHLLKKRSFSNNNNNNNNLHHLLFPRQSIQGNGTGPSADGYPSCTAVSNAILSCFPQSNTVLIQHNWSKFIWNNNYPTFIGSRFIDIYLFNAQSETIVANWTSIPNDRGMIGIYANDNWFPPISNWKNGQNLTYPYFFVITTAGATLTGGEQHQSTFAVVQTAPPPSYISASLSSASASYTSDLLKSSTQSAPSPTNSPNSSLQNPSEGNSFPKWEIALIVILGALALGTFLIASYLAFNNARKRRQVRRWQAAGRGSAGSVGSNSPMIQNTEDSALMGQSRNPGMLASARDLSSPFSSRPGSPLSTNLAPGTTSLALASEVVSQDHHRQSLDVKHSIDGPITPIDATMMADAFRKALRKPEFIIPEPLPEDVTSSVEAAEALGTDNDNIDNIDNNDNLDQRSGPSPSQRMRQSMHAQVMTMDDLSNNLDNPQTDHSDEAKEIMDRELASEGRSMTSVDTRRRPKVFS